LCFVVLFLICQASVEITTEKTSYIGSENVIVQVVVSNTHPSEPMHLLNWFANGEDKHIFTISNSNYNGPCFKRVKPTSMRFYTTIAAGDSVSFNITLDTYYSFINTEEYSITYNVRSWDLFYQQDVNSLVSNTLTILIEGRSFVGKRSFFT
jgi:hypothetical protein